MPQIIVSDTNIWIACHRSRLLEQVFELPYEFVTTDLAFMELLEPSGGKLRRMGLQVQSLTREQVLRLFALNEQWSKPSLADISCYLYASEQLDRILLTGDGAIRQRAEQEQLPVHGLLWLLDELVAQGVLEQQQAADALQGMRDGGTYLPDAVCDERMKRWRK